MPVVRPNDLTMVRQIHPAERRVFREGMTRSANGHTTLEPYSSTMIARIRSFCLHHKSGVRLAGFQRLQCGFLRCFFDSQFKSRKRLGQVDEQLAKSLDLQPFLNKQCELGLTEPLNASACARNTPSLSRTALACFKRAFACSVGTGRYALRSKRNASRSISMFDIVVLIQIVSYPISALPPKRNRIRRLPRTSSTDRYPARAPSENRMEISFLYRRSI